MEFGDQFTGTLEQRNLRILREVMPSVVVGKPRVILFRQIGEQGSKRLAQPQADDVAGLGAARHRQSHIPAGSLDTGGDDAGGIHEGTVPIEDQEIETSVWKMRHVARSATVEMTKAGAEPAFVVYLVGSSGFEPPTPAV